MRNRREILRRRIEGRRLGMTISGMSAGVTRSPAERYGSGRPGEATIPAMRRSRQEAAVLGWLELLPDEVVRVRPVLSVGFAGALLAGGEYEAVEARLQQVEDPLVGREIRLPQAELFAAHLGQPMKPPGAREDKLPERAAVAGEAAAEAVFDRR